MSSIGLFARHSNRNEIVDAPWSPGGRRRVLPHVFRRPVRLLNRLLAGNLVISRRGRLVLGAAVVLAAGTGILANSQKGHSIIADLSAKMGFTINSVVIEGADELSKIDVLSSLDLGRSNSLLTFDIGRARKDLHKLAWVRNAFVAKSYPDRLIIQISERQPFAIWQDQKTLSLVERGGKAIDSFDEKFGSLPLLVGKGANVHGADIIFLVGKIPVLKGKVKSYARIADRRWDLHLKNGMIVRLPDENPGAALAELSRLEKVHQILARDLEVVDLRLNGRLVVAMDEAVIRQHADHADKSTSISSTMQNNLPAKKPVGDKEKKI